MANQLEKILPSFFASAKTDTVLRYAAGAIGGAVVGWAAGWARSRGWYVPDKDVLNLAAQGIGGMVVVAVVARLGVNAVTKSEAVVVNNTVRAAITGEVPQAIADKATQTQIDHIVASPVATVSPAPPMPAVKVE